MPSIMNVNFTVRGKYVCQEIGTIETMSSKEAIEFAAMELFQNADFGDLKEASTSFAEVTPIRGKWEVVFDVMGFYPMKMKYDRDPKGLNEKACKLMEEKSFGDLQEVEWEIYDPKKEREEEEVER